ncbi:hypothetical protein JOQ06_027358 [Pogonophryne albipinna]|uniref:DUF7030 domain-containing protein n=1 Tax=Pogonophryne albipinna TaxID=1090488 RepID=A0AAD6BAF8_9TELE|nr:hypothetical protein JOQ06_027358 [Pogonophryne albipinna]
MAVEARPELVGKRFLCVSGEESPEIGDTDRWPWRSGVIRAVNHRDNDSLDLTQQWLSHVNASSFEFTHCTEFNSFSTGLQQQLRELTQNKHTKKIKCLIPPTEYLHNAHRTE